MARMWMMIVDVVVFVVEVMAWRCPSIDFPSRSLLELIFCSRFMVVASLFAECEIQSHVDEILDHGELAVLHTVFSPGKACAPGFLSIMILGYYYIN